MIKNNLLSVLHYQKLLQDAEIWYLDFNDIRLANISQLFVLLSEEEKDKANAFTQAKHRKNYIISHAYLRLLFTKYHQNVHPDEWKFSINKYGKPSLDKEHNVKMFFNISHTDTHVAYIFSSTNVCGIDIEENMQSEIYYEVVDMLFTENEKILFHKSIDKSTLFYRLWTLKEAYTKTLGIALETVFQQIDFGTVKEIDSSKSILFFKSTYQFGIVDISSTIWLSCCLKYSKDKRKKSMV